MTKAAELAKMGEVLTNSQIGSRRNIFVNGAMNISQRATSATDVGANNGVYPTVDRIKVVALNTAGRATMSQVADVHDGFANALKLECTTADTSIASNEIFVLQSGFEGQDLQQLKKGTSDAEKVTVSFYVKGNASATYGVELEDGDNSRFNAQSFAVTTNWTRVTKTFIADTTGSLDDDNALSLSLNIWLHGGSDYSGGTFSSNTWHTTTNQRMVDSQTSFFDSTDRTFFITGIQIEIGSVATPFEHRSFGEEIILCQRYFRLSNDGSSAYQAVGNAVGYGETTSSFTAFWTWETEMRATPTLAIFNEGVSYGSVIVRQDQSYFCDGVALGVGGKKGLLINLTTPDNTGGDTTFQDGVPGGVYTSTNNIAWSLDAEL